MVIDEKEFERRLIEAYQLGWRAAMESIMPTSTAIGESLTGLRESLDSLGETLKPMEKPSVVSRWPFFGFVPFGKKEAS